MTGTRLAYLENRLHLRIALGLDGHCPRSLWIWLYGIWIQGEVYLESGNLRPLMTKIPASSMYSVGSGPTGSWTASVSESPLATSSASSERSVNNNHAVIMDGHGSELEDDLVSERGGHACPNIVHGL